MTTVANNRRAGGSLVVVAAGVMFVGAAIPFFAPSLRDAPWSDDLQELLGVVAGNPAAWRWANGLILSAAALTALGLVPVTMGFGGAARSWAAMGLVSYLFCAVVAIIDRLISIGPATWAAEEGISVTDATVQAFIRFGNGLNVAFYVFGFLALGLYGVALTRVTEASGAGWAFVGAGGLGIVLGSVGAAIPGFVFLGTGALGLVMRSRSLSAHR